MPEPSSKTALPRRVGTFTMGLFLIVLGLCLLGYWFIPAFPIVLAGKLAPLVLILLGAEVLYYTTHPGLCRVDCVSILLCLLVLGSSFMMAWLPVAADYALRHGSVDFEQSLEREE